MVPKRKRLLARILFATTLCGGLMLVTPGCGSQSKQVREPAPPNNVPPGGGSADEYARKMAEIKGGRPGGPGGPGSAPGAPGAPGAPR